ncbi:RNA polymerase sigma factor [Prosthecobacter sp.]|uniref:RNA polymerase sigma factor n=1 Tax=Prosthecobacter sp. TaxID=1965333 RepID=UPI0037852DAC
MNTTTADLHSGDEYDRLFARAMEGDAMAAERLYAQCVPWLAGWLGQRFSPHVAEDVAHEAMAEAFRQGGEFEARGSFCGWLRSIGMHRALNTLRNEARRKSREQLYCLDGVAPEREQLHDQHHRLCALLARLPSTQRELLVLHYVQGKSSRDIAAMHGRTRSAVAVNLHRLCRSLRERMEATRAPRRASGESWTPRTGTFVTAHP